MFGRWFRRSSPIVPCVDDCVWTDEPLLEKLGWRPDEAIVSYSPRDRTRATPLPAETA